MTALWTARQAIDATRGTSSGTWSVGGVSIDTRTVKAGDLFVALQGENRDGHAFVAEALSKGASAALVARSIDGVDRSKLLIDDPLGPFLAEIFHQQRRGKTPIHFQLAVPTGAGAFDHRLGEIGCDESDLPIADGWDTFEQRHRDSVRLLPARTRGAPD